MENSICVASGALIKAILEVQSSVAAVEFKATLLSK